MRMEQDRFMICEAVYEVMPGKHKASLSVSELWKWFCLRKRYFYFYEKPRLETALIKRGFLCLYKTATTNKPLP